ncbi:MAG: hypothetical protein GWN46_21030 [Gammaproteobacteria bacterium]|nr:hypothetical protein [Gammaproteobacteria bacterium]NIP65225.1 hypothetical protein [Gammaproteobacteria bacterium]NIP90332.1 hypothetical protein [Gammaproteobacteria bacterium]NIQ27393.1 hypothetical protein [Gammaproteobacteria bacterium]NIV49109.1 hypothetical protein [Gammaproteobacteria bacterium]
MGSTANQLNPFARSFRTQALVMLVIAGASLGLGVEAAYSALLGGMIAIIPEYYFARRVFRRYPHRSPVESAALMLRAEIVKLVLAVLMFAAVFAFIMAVNVVALIVGFVMVKATGLVASVRYS